MRKNYSELSRGVESRLNPEGFILEKAFRDELFSISYSDVLMYIRSAMKGVEPEYTRRSKDAGEKVKDHLKTVLTDVIYKYQGSVMTDTHIKGYSDIDLLAICDKFYSWDSSGIREAVEDYSKRQQYSDSSVRKLQRKVDNFSPYEGSSLDDLREIRLKSESKLRSVYLECDTSKPKAIRIKNRNLNREVDIVTANWYDDISSIINDLGDYRGVQVFNKEKDIKGQTTYPFLSIARINNRSSATNGRLKKMIRFLKHLKADSNLEIDLSSFDLNAVCYDIDPRVYDQLSFYELVPVLYRQLKRICQNNEHADSLVSVDGHEYIFRFNQIKLQNLRLLLGEIENIYLDLYESKLLAS